ncbi:MAG: helix-turn-helix transcriptional regulator [Synergistaceae bacterium]|nr:helix-turn-helix transcriptional regulator [Synergistaceae bacterium]
MNGERVRKRRKELNLSGETVAEALGTTRVTISRWESDTSDPDDKTKLALAKVLRTSVAYLIGETNNPNPIHATSEIPPDETTSTQGVIFPDESSKETLHQEKPGYLKFRQGDCYLEVPDTPSNQAWFRELSASVIMAGFATGATARKEKNSNGNACSKCHV